MPRTTTVRCALSTVALACALGLAPARGHADWHRKTERDGLGVSLGLGQPYGGVGAQLTYWMQLHGSLFRLAAHGGGGVIIFNDPVKPGWDLGVSSSWGHKHRVLLGASFGVVSGLRVTLHGENIYRTMLGPSLCIGYEYMTLAGFFLRLTGGVGYIVGTPILPARERFVPTATLLGVGYKLW